MSAPTGLRRRARRTLWSISPATTPGWQCRVKNGAWAGLRRSSLAHWAGEDAMIPVRGPDEGRKKRGSEVSLPRFCLRISASAYAAFRVFHNHDWRIYSLLKVWRFCQANEFRYADAPPTSFHRIDPRPRCRKHDVGHPSRISSATTSCF